MSHRHFEENSRLLLIILICNSQTKIVYKEAGDHSYLIL